MCEWSDSIESAIRLILSKSNARRVKHINYSYRYLLYSNVLIYSCMLLTPLAGTLLTIDSDEFKTYVIVITYFCGIINSIVKFSGYDKLASKHTDASFKYQSLISNAERQLCLERQNREDAKAYLTWFSNSYDEILLSSPVINENSQEASSIITLDEMIPLNIDKIVVEKAQKHNLVEIKKYADDKMMYEIDRFRKNLRENLGENLEAK
jgi:hypothetical protein